MLATLFSVRLLDQKLCDGLSTGIEKIGAKLVRPRPCCNSLTAAAAAAKATTTTTRYIHGYMHTYIQIYMHSCTQGCMPTRILIHLPIARSNAVDGIFSVRASCYDIATAKNNLGQRPHPVLALWAFRV